jgi:hypothetical protein
MRIFFWFIPLYPSSVFGTKTRPCRRLSFLSAFGPVFNGEGFPGLSFVCLGADFDLDRFLVKPPGVGNKWKTTWGLVYSSNIATSRGSFPC